MIYLPKSRRDWSLALLLIFYLAAGVNHFRMPALYEALVPDYLPWKSLLNLLAGIAEIVLAILLAFSTTRRFAAACLVALLLAFIPAHIWFIQQGGCPDAVALCVPAWVAWIRLLLVHPLLIAWAWWHYKFDNV